MRALSITMLFILSTFSLIAWGAIYGNTDPNKLGVMEWFNLGLCLWPSIVIAILGCERPSHGGGDHPRSGVVHWTPLKGRENVHH
jgi:hypothetical protein